MKKRSEFLDERGNPVHSEYALTKQSTTWNPLAVLILSALLIGSSATAQAPVVSERTVVKLHRQLSMLIVELTTLEAILNNIPATAPQRQGIDNALYSIREKVSQLISITPPRVDRQRVDRQRPPKGRVPVIPTESRSTTTTPKKIMRPEAMKKAAFIRLLTTVKSESFANSRLQVIRSAAEHHYFTTKQVGALLDSLSFSDKKLKAIRALHPQIIDPENAFQLYGAFTFESDKRKLRAILEN